MAAISLRVVEETWQLILVDHVTFERHDGRRLPYSRTYILCQINNAQIAKHAAFLTAGTRFAHWSIWNDLSGAAGQSCRIQELFLHQNRVTQESCGSAMMQYTKKHMVDYCSACSVVHIVVQCTIHCNICKRNAWVQKGETCIIITSAKQTNDILKVMTNK